MEIPSEPGMVGARQEYRLLKITSELRAESMYRQKKAGRKQVGTDGVPPLEGTHMAVCRYRWFTNGQQAPSLRQDGAFYIPGKSRIVKGSAGNTLLRGRILIYKGRKISF